MIVLNFTLKQICKIVTKYNIVNIIENTIIDVWKSGENAGFDRIIYKQIYK